MLMELGITWDSYVNGAGNYLGIPMLMELGIT